MTSVEQDRSDPAEVAQRARLVADALDSLPKGVETPTHVDLYTSQLSPTPGLGWLLFSGPTLDQQKTRATAIIRTIGGHWDKQPGELFAFKAMRNGVLLHIAVEREAVCERVVTGTREVTKTVPAPDAPTVEVTETVEDVEWVCAPLLAEPVSA